MQCNSLAITGEIFSSTVSKSFENVFTEELDGRFQYNGQETVVKLPRRSQADAKEEGCSQEHGKD